VSAYEPFARVYDRWAADMTEDVPFYVDLARSAGEGAIVELAVGTGRVAVPVVTETRRVVVGVDSSREMLERAREHAKAAGVAHLLDLREGDMRHFALDVPATLVYCPFRSLLHLPTWEDKRRTFERVAAALESGGRFAWNAYAYSFRIAAEREGRHVEPLPHTVRHVDAESRTDVELEGHGVVSLWWATKNEWLGLVEAAGLEVEALYGWFDRRPFTDESTEFVFVARKR